MSKNPTVIFSKKENQKVDSDFLEEMHAAFPGYIGLTFVETDEDGTQKLSSFNDVSYEDLKDTCQGDTALHFCLGKEELSEDHRMPNGIRDAETEELLAVVFLEGDFLELGDPTGSSPLEFRVANNYLVAKLGELFKDFEDNADPSAKVCEVLNRTTTQREILASVCPSDGGRCEILFVFPNGKTASIIKGDAHRVFDWGFSSRSSTDPKAAEPVPVVEEKPLTGIAKLKADAAAKKNGGTTTAVKPAAPVAANKTPTGTADLPMILPSKGRCVTAKGLKDFYEQFSAVGLPDGWEQGIGAWSSAIPVPIKKSVYEDAKRWSGLIGSKQLMVFNEKEHPREAPKVDAGGDGKSVQDAASETSIKLLTPEREKKSILEIHNRLIKTRDDAGSLILPDEKVIALLSSKEPTATVEIGIGNIDVFKNYSEDAFFELAKTSPRWVARFMSQQRLQILLLEEELADYRKKAKKTAM
jgi:hypothetical protein